MCFNLSINVRESQMDNPEILAQRTKINKHKNRTQVNKTMSKADHAKNRDMNPCAREGQPMVHNGTNIKVEWYTNEITLDASNWGFLFSSLGLIFYL